MVQLCNFKMFQAQVKRKDNGCQIVSKQSQKLNSLWFENVFNKSVPPKKNLL